jgi:hypothetical protein
MKISKITKQLFKAFIGLTDRNTIHGFKKACSSIDTKDTQVFLKFYAVIDNINYVNSAIKQHICLNVKADVHKCKRLAQLKDELCRYREEFAELRKS